MNGTILGGFALLATMVGCDMARDGVAAGDVNSYRALAAETQGAADSYRVTMMGATVATCAAVHGRYDDQVRPLIAHMVEMSGTMDGVIGAHDGAGVADMGCIADAMLAELDAHRMAACGAPDLGGDRAEAIRHAGAVAEYTAHERQRCDEILGGLDGQGWTWGSMMGMGGAMMGGCGAQVPSR